MTKKSTMISLIGLFILYSVFIIVQSFEHADGYLSSDSAHYLQLATNILEGNGFTTTDLIPEESAYFATWPVGYSILISGVSFVSGFGVFVSSKLVNIMILGLCFLLIYLLFKEKAFFVSIVFTISTCTEIFSYTWSEVPFLFGMLWLVYGMIRYYETEKSSYAVQLSLASLCLFLMRYIGLIGAGMVGLLGFYYLFQKKWKPMLVCWISGSIPILLAGGYLWNNLQQTGNATGMERIPRPETTAEFFDMLWNGIVVEWNLLSISSEVYVWWSASLVLATFLMFVRWSSIKALFSKELPGKRYVPLFFLFAGTIYFIAIVGMRWTSQFDPFNFRLLGPATFMFALALVSWFVQTEGIHWVRWRRFLLALFAMTVVMNIGLSTYQAVTSNDTDYMDTRRTVLATYQEIPSDSIVAMENIHARYLRPDLQYIKVHFKPYFKEKESVEAFLDRVTPNKAEGVYVEHKALSPHRYHESFVQLMEENSAHFIRLE
ncbi:ArnT family glycosyltransferase [Radiobacillus deserti]|uniref:Glycosyltransferase RgtA/B/C/D-like domain-containing protein n=1 Tax=Radiobacillus deserti TaxID=2594883 RepID=A0A516KJP4_9BACI|nr:hypothetical protein [Radiobacillus deserti]QDP41601.1 hypothetical protein FN924_16350 [Radiobacillus deserti]